MAIYKRGDTWWISFTIADGRRIRQSAGTQDKRKAQELHDKLKSQSWDEVKLNAKPNFLWHEAVIRWCDEMRHKKDIDTDIVHLRWLDKYLANKSLDEIDKNIRKEKLASGSSNATVNRVLAVVRKILNIAAKEWEVSVCVPHIKMLPEPKKRVRWLTVKEVEQLLNELPQHLQSMVRFSLATGLRESNVTQLRWSQVDMQRQCAWIHPE